MQMVFNALSGIPMPEQSVPTFTLEAPFFKADGFDFVFPSQKKEFASSAKLLSETFTSENNAYALFHILLLSSVDSPDLPA